MLTPDDKIDFQLKGTLAVTVISTVTLFTLGLWAAIGIFFAGIKVVNIVINEC